MKILQISQGGHPRHNNDLMHLQASISDGLAAENSKYAILNSPIKGVILSGVNLETTATLNIFNVAGGWIAVNSEVYAVNAVSGLNLSAGNKLFATINTSAGDVVTTLTGNPYSPYLNNTMDLYTAPVPQSSNDFEVGTHIVPYSEWLAKMMGFTNQYLTITQDQWHEIGGNQPGDIALNTGFNGYAGGIVFKKSQTDSIFLEGALIATANTNGSFCRLPPAYRPDRELLIPIVSVNISVSPNKIIALLTINQIGNCYLSLLQNGANIDGYIFYINTSFNL